MSRLLLRYLAYLGPDKKNASINLEPGLNVICGASETGKSFLVESLDFMLGGRELPRDIPERAGYDRLRLLIESAGWPSLGLERSIEGGHFFAYEEELRDGNPAAEATVLREQHSGARQDTLSHALLERLGLTDKRLRRNRSGETRSVSIRDLIRLSVVTEEEIQRRGSPLLSGQWVQGTLEYAAFKLLLTGTDDSALVSASEVAGKADAVSGKIEILEQMIEELQHEIQEEGLDEAELQDQLSKLTNSIDEQNRALDAVQAILDELLEKRSAAVTDIERLRARKLEIEELTNRFGLLNEHYNTDLKRLEAIQESGSLFVHLERKDCPLCGATPSDQHLGADCDGNTEKIVSASTAEMEKIGWLKRELRDTVASLEHEKEQIKGRLPQYENANREFEKKLSEIVKPAVSTERASYNELVSKRAEVASALSKFTRVQRLFAQKKELEGGDTDSDGPTTETRTMIPKLTLDQFSQTVERILAEWHFPNASRVFFDESKKDFQIAGKDRGSTGKGLRAITHAAVNVGLLEFCLEHDLPHPGFVVLDSPLLAYWKPEGQEDDLRGTDLKEKFYQYLLGLKAHAQVIIIENEHPPDFVQKEGNVIVFTKNPHQGRYGFFPIPETGS